MKVILTIGAPHSAHTSVFELITQSGVICAQPCRDASLSPQNLQEQLLRSMEVDLNSGAQIAQVNPGRLWNELAGDLFLTNIDHPVWGWVDHQTAYLMDFWREFDPQVRLLLVYNSPLAYLQSVLDECNTVTPEAITAALATWSRWNTALLRYFHRHPQHCLLVNSQQAMAEPMALNELLKTKWQMTGLVVKAAGGSSSSESDLLAYLIAQVTDPHHPTWALNQELESVAHLTLPAPAATTDPSLGIAAAWADWAKTRARFMAVSQELATLGTTSKEQAKLLAERQTQLDATGNARAEAAAQRDALVKDKAELTAARDAQTKLATESQSALTVLQTQHESLLQEKVKLIADGAELARARDQLVSQKDAESEAKAEALAQRNAIANELAAQALAVSTAGSQLGEFKQENDMLLLQLHQVQEELESYFLKHQALLPAVDEGAKAIGQVALLQQNAEQMLLQLDEVQRELEGAVVQRLAVESQLQSKATSFVADFWRVHQPAKVVIDMRREITGSNWYDAEADGRWAGLEPLSTLQLPPMQAGRYTLEFDIVDAMHLDMVSGMVVELMGQVIPVEVVFPMYRGEYPVIAKACVDISPGTADQPWSIGLRFTKLISPVAHGSNDTRNLTIMLRTLHMLKHE